MTDMLTLLVASFSALSCVPLAAVPVLGSVCMGIVSQVQKHSASRMLTAEKYQVISYWLMYMEGSWDLTIPG